MYMPWGEEGTKHRFQRGSRKGRDHVYSRGFTLRRTVQRWHIHSPGGSISSLSGGLLQEKHKATLYCYFWNASAHTRAAQGRAALRVLLPEVPPLLYSDAPRFQSPIHPLSKTSLNRFSSTTPIPFPPCSALQCEKTVSELNSKEKWRIHLRATHRPPS